MFYTKEEFEKELCDICRRGELPQYGGESVQKLFTICEMLDERSKSFNLTAITEPWAVMRKHIADCLYFAEALRGEGTKSLIDVGSGAGFPSLPTAAVLPDTAVTALDSTAKKVAYMKECAAVAGIVNFDGIADRAEEAAHTALRESFDAAGARAVASLRVLLELCTPFVRVGGTFVAMKGAAALEEAEEAKSAAKVLGCELAECRQYFIPDLEEKRFLLIYRKISPAKAIHPRNYSQITKKPL